MVSRSFLWVGLAGTFAVPDGRTAEGWTVSTVILAGVQDRGAVGQGQA